MQNCSAYEMKKLILDKYKYRTELHAHTSPVSGCADFSPEETVEKYAALGYDSIVISNHITYSGRAKMSEKGQSAKEFVEWFVKDYYEAKAVGDKLGINVILGAEIRFKENSNDYLVYGIDEEKLEVICDAITRGIADFKKNDALKDVLIIQAHPFRDGMKEVDPSYIDGVETFNMHAGHNSRIACAVEYARENGFKITTAGSDFHHEGAEGMCAIRTKVIPKDTYDIERILREGDYAFEIAENSVVLP